MSGRAIIVCAATAAACAHGVRSATPSPLERGLARALEDVSYRGAAARRVGALVVARTAGGAALVTPRGGAAGARGRDDRALETAVRARLSTDPRVARFWIDVDVVEGLVTLAGHVEVREDAARAVSLALEPAGARAAESRLTWVPRGERARLHAGAGGDG